jgi:O-antigen/teichoic acid export membrane protein
MVFAVMWLRKSGLLTFRPFTHLAKIASSAPPLVLAQLAGWGVSLADRIIVIHLMNAANVGLYSLGSRFAMVIMMLGTSFSIAWAPFFYDTLRSGDLRGNVRIVYATYIYGTAMVAISIVYGICAHWVIHFIVDPRFFKASDFVLLLSLAYCADGIWKMFVGYLIFHGRFVAYSTIACAAAVLNVTLDFVFVRQWGAIGAAWAALVAIGLGMLVTLIMAVRIHPMPWFSFLGMNQAEVPAID